MRTPGGAVSDDGNQQHVKIMEALGITEMRAFKPGSPAQTRIRSVLRQLYYDMEHADEAEFFEDERVRDIHRIRAQGLTAVLRMVLKPERREELIAEIQREYERKK